MPTSLLRHVREHPGRLLVTALAMLVASLALLGLALYTNIQANRKQANQAHAIAVANCVALNELRRQLYTASLDLGVQEGIAARFLPHQDCEVLP